MLFGRYRVVDHAIKVVGVGSVGTRCAVALMQADGDDALILQIKQALGVGARTACRSERFPDARRTAWCSGQRLVQSASDALLGWGTSGEYQFYVRQYRDKKGSVNLAGDGRLRIARIRADVRLGAGHRSCAVRQCPPDRGLSG